jgi:L-lactate dehydrogenase complex protein LldG
MAYITRLAQQKDAHLVVRWQSDLLEALEVDAAMQQHGVTVYTTALPPGAASGEVTSTGPMTTRRQELRDLLARTSQVIAPLADSLLLAQAAATDPQQHLTSCVSFVTGPSRTGDIELQLTIGVHGPGELHLVVFG